jgi:hypothetical protein
LAQTFGPPAPQTRLPVLQGGVPVQVIVPPHPSGAVPQLRAPQACGVQPQRPATPPPPQVCGSGQPPQSSMPPQPSGI